MITALILAKENRVMITEVQKNVVEIKKCIQKLTNHYSNRLPVWATITITLLGIGVR